MPPLMPALRILLSTLVALALLGTNAVAATVQVIEYYNSSQDHYFISSLPADIQALDSGQFQGWARTGALVRGLCRGHGQREPRVPLLHSAGAGRLAFLLGVAHRVRADGGHVPDVRRGIAERDVRRPARPDDGRVSRRRHTGLSRVGQPRRHQPSLHGRSQPAHADGRAGMDRRRLRSRPGDHVRADDGPAIRRAAAVHRATIPRWPRPTRRTACTCGIRTPHGAIPAGARQRRDRQGPHAVRREPRHLLVRRRARAGRVRLERGDRRGEAVYRRGPRR